MTLHIFHKGLNNRQLLEDCLNLIDTSDALLFIEDGAYWCLDNTKQAEWLIDYCRKIQFNSYVLSSDCNARGIMSKLNAQHTLVDYAEFVDLCVKYQPSVTWI